MVETTVEETIETVEAMMLKQVSCFRQDANSKFVANIHTGHDRSIAFETIRVLYSLFEQSTKRGIFVANKRYICIDFTYIDGTVAVYQEGSSTKYQKIHSLSDMELTSPLRPSVVCQTNVHNVASVSTYVPTQSPTSVCISEVWEFVYKKHFVYRLRKSMKGRNKYQAGMDAVPSFHVEMIVLRSCLACRDDVYIAHSVLEKIKDLYGRFENNSRHDLPLTCRTYTESNTVSALE